MLLLRSYWLPIMLSFYCIKPSDWLVVPLLLIQHIGSVLAEILASMLDVSIELLARHLPKANLSPNLARMARA